MIKTSSTQQELITVKDAAKLLKRSSMSVYQYIHDGLIDAERQNVTKVYKRQVLELKEMLENRGKSISPFGDLALDKDESLKFLDMFNDPHILGNPYKYMTRCKYGVTNKGRIINLTLNHVLTPYTVDHGYLQVLIGKKSELLHRAVACQWCPNGRFKTEVHHIDGSRTNNHAKNLIWMTPEEHDKAHRLFEIAKKSGDWQEYYLFIGDIKNDNEWKEDLRMIIDPEDGSDSKMTHVWFVKKQGYVDYKSGIKSWDDLFSDCDIRAEGYFANRAEAN